MKVIRKTRSLCPECAAEVDAVVAVSDGKAVLFRECPEHGAYEYVLSEHGAEYADLDRFYIALNGLTPRGRIMNIWILCTMHCQQNCCYCSAEIQHPTLGEMNQKDFADVLDRFGYVKLTLTGGEPTLHPELLDFLHEALRRGVSVQIATNGLKLASKEFCQRLKAAGVREVRLSLESLDPKIVEPLDLAPFVEAKLEAIRNLGELGMTVTLSPTLFKGVNDEQLYHIIEYAKDKPFIRKLAVGGFSWNGNGATLPPEMMFSPDAMMDIVHRHYCSCDRQDVFTFQKLMFAVAHVMDVRLCLNSQLMIFVRDGANELRPILDFMAMRRLSKALDWWIRALPRNRWMRVFLLLPVLASGICLRTVPRLPMFLRFLWGNLRQVDTARYPAELLIAALNTNCATLNADLAVSAQCMSVTVLKRDDALCETNASIGLLEKERENRQSGVWTELRAASSNRDSR